MKNRDEGKRRDGGLASSRESTSITTGFRKHELRETRRRNNPIMGFEDEDENPETT